MSANTSRINSCSSCVSGVPPVPPVPGEVRLHWTTRNPGNRRGAPAEASGGGSPAPLPFGGSKPHRGQLGARLVRTDSHRDEERTVQAVRTRLWDVRLPQTWQHAAPVGSAHWALHRVQSPRRARKCLLKTNGSMMLFVSFALCIPLLTEVPPSIIAFYFLHI